MKLNLLLSILFLLAMSFLNSTAQVTKLSNNTNLSDGGALGNIGVMLTTTDSLWKTDGTALGTMKYANNVAASTLDAVLSNKIYFQGTTTANGEELWVTDGTTATLVDDIEPGATSSSPQELVTFNNMVFFFATTVANGTELWKTDGTTTVMVKDINPAQIAVLITLLALLFLRIITFFTLQRMTAQTAWNYGRLMERA